MNKGKASTWGAVSIVNAIAGGKGATISVKLTTEAVVELEDKPGPWETVVNGKPTESRLAKETVARAIKEAGKDPNSYSGRIETSSGTPIGVGLKTSSSASTAVAIAVQGAIGKGAFDPSKAMGCSIEASIASGASITGAMDDAASCVLGGMNYVDNLARKVVMSRLFPKPLKVVIKVPKVGSARAATDVEFVKKFGNLADHFFRMGLEGDQWKAMVLNGLTYSSILKYDPFPALRAMEMGALGAGLSGTGPAVAAVFDPARSAEFEALAKDWATDGSTVIKTETNNEHARIVTIE